MVFTFIQISHREILSHTVERRKTWNVYTVDFISETFIYQVQNYSPVHVMIYDPSSYQGWVSPHIYYLQRRNPFFFSFFCFFHLALSSC